MLIAEIGSNHFGNMENARELIRVARECGADLVKGQAFLAKDIKSGSMPKEFYESCQLDLFEYIELLDYAKDIGIDLFFTIFSPELDTLTSLQNYNKISAHQFKNDEYNPMLLLNENTFVSCPAGTWDKQIHDAIPLHVSEYLTDTPNLQAIILMRKKYNTLSVGYSDHTIGINACVEAAVNYRAYAVEKHFCLEKNVKIFGQVFRDTIHGCNPSELEQLANLIK